MFPVPQVHRNENQLAVELQFITQDRYAGLVDTFALTNSNFAHASDRERVNYLLRAIS
jgi:hypothetical protein